MPIATKILGMFAAMEPRDLERLAPATRQRFAQEARYWADIAEPPYRLLPSKRTSPTSGVLYELKGGRQA